MLKKFKSLIKNTAGSIVPMTAVLIIPLTVTIGAAVDYTNYTKLQNEVQTAIDAASVATAREFIDYKPPNGMTDPDAIKAHKEATLKAYAISYAKANISSKVGEDEFEIGFSLEPDPDDPKKERLKVTSKLNYQTIFGQIGGSKGGYGASLNADLASVVALGNKTVEIALVLDNSGSMAFESGNTSTSQNKPASKSKRRITLLETEAKKLVDNMYAATEGSQLSKPVQFSIVPFSSSVNVGNIDHVNHKGGNNFLDTKGFAPSHNENFDWVNTYRPAAGESVEARHGVAAVLKKSDGSESYLSRLDIFKMIGMEWEGCVEMRPYPHNIQDTYGNASAGYKKNRAKKLFVPYLVPDGPDPEYYDYYSSSWWSSGLKKKSDVSVLGSTYYSNNYLEDFLDYDPSTQLAEPRFQDDNNFGQGDTGGIINDKQIQRTNWVWKYQAIQGLDKDRINDIPNSGTKNKELKAILKDIDLPESNKNTNSNGSSYFDDSGPNAYCPDLPILQLEDDKAKVKAELGKMEAHGGTNIHLGLTWGWRTLSPGKPFTGGRKATSAGNVKLLILLTDGNNQMLPEQDGYGKTTPNNTQYTAWGFQRDEDVLKHPISGEDTHRRLLDGAGDTSDTIYASGLPIDPTPDDQAEYEDLMNLHTNQACNNIKADGVTIITIAFDVPENNPLKPQYNKVRDLLQACSGPGIVNGQKMVEGITFYHDVKGLELEDVFAEIADGISAIRIAE